jgi:hypothetical protein
LDSKGKNKIDILSDIEVRLGLGKRIMHAIQS